MQSLSERTLLLIMLVVTGLSTLFCFIGLVTPGWGGLKTFVFSLGVPLAAGPLAIISMLFLIACVIILILMIVGILQHQYVPLGFVALLIVTSIFLLGTFSSYFSSSYAYSVNLMVTAFFFTYLTSIIGTYWLASIHGLPGMTKTADISQPPHLSMDQTYSSDDI